MPKSGRVTARDARSILGPQFLISAAEVVSAWNLGRHEQPKVLGYSLAAIEECSEANYVSGENWHLVYIVPLSLEDMRRRIYNQCRMNGVFMYDTMLASGAGRRYPKTNVLSVMRALRHDVPHDGYTLINFSGTFGGLMREEQDWRIRELPFGAERAHETAVAQAVFMFHALRYKRLLSDFRHWGKPLDPSGSAISVGPFAEPDVMLPLGIAANIPAPDLKVCVFRKEDL